MGPSGRVHVLIGIIGYLVSSATIRLGAHTFANHHQFHKIETSRYTFPIVGGYLASWVPMVGIRLYWNHWASGPIGLLQNLRHPMGGFILWLIITNSSRSRHPDIHFQFLLGIWSCRPQRFDICPPWLYCLFGHIGYLETLGTWWMVIWGLYFRQSPSIPHNITICIFNFRGYLVPLLAL